MLSVVIPTHNRSDSAVRLAKALDAQECKVPFEIIFALDGCRDDTKIMLESLSLKRPLKIVELDGRGAAAARNKGAASAEGDILLFVDDDIVPQPNMLSAHIAHRISEESLVVGPYPYGPDMPVNPLDFFIRDWWHVRFQALAVPTHVFTYKDCLTGNLSMSRRMFENAGSFDEIFEKDGREDYELGVRLLKLGGRMTFAPDALAYHYPKNKPKSLLRKWYTFGKADVRFAQKQPEVFWSLPMQNLLRKRKWKHRWAMNLALSLPLVDAAIIYVMGTFFESNLERLWDRRLLRLWYICQRLAYIYGVRTELGGWCRLQSFLRSKLETAEWPENRVRIEDVDILADLSEIGDMDDADKLFLIARTGYSIKSWVEAPCRPGRDSMPTEEIAECLSNNVGWPAWHSSLDSNVQSIWPKDFDNDAWRKLTVGMLDIEKNKLARCDNTSSVNFSDMSVIVLCGKEEEMPRSILDSAEVIGVTVGNGRACGKLLSAALSLCKGRLVAFLKPSDSVDIGWSRAVYGHFQDHSISCVITPAILRGIRTRGEELYHRLADFERVTTWDFAYLSEYLPAAHILDQYNTACHRFIFERKALVAACEALNGSMASYEDITARLLYESVCNYHDIVYEPKAIVWNESQIKSEDVRSMAAQHSYRISKMVCERMFSRNIGKTRAARTLVKLMRFKMRKPLQSACGTLDWPISFAANEAASAVQGVCGGLMERDGKESGDISVTVQEHGGVIWVS